jgi:hypothetical protein
LQSPTQASYGKKEQSYPKQTHPLRALELAQNPFKEYVQTKGEGYPKKVSPFLVDILIVLECRLITSLEQLVKLGISLG